MNRSPTPQEVADHMWAHDRASTAAGMSLVSVGHGTATLALTVRNDHVNGLDLCHGGIIFQFADSAMAFASNSANEVAVAAGAAIDFLAPAKLGDHLIAEATEYLLDGRSGFSDVRVSRPKDGQVIALFRGRTRRLGRLVVSAAEAPL